MKKLLTLFALAVCCAAPPLRAQNDYPLTEDSKPKADVPKGEILKFTFDKSQIFPGTSRSVSVYVPKQYDPAKPACVYVNQDGVQWNAPTVFDNLIAKGEMPVTIGVFVTPGVVAAANGNALPRFNRSLEYDGLGPAYANFILNEILPFVETQKTADGRAIVLSKNGNDRAIGGSSSGAVCAFTAAWERPDAFSRVFSAIGTYVGLRGAHEYPTLIRKYEPKPIRVFLQDGSNDNNIYGGDWWIANQAMQRSFAFAGYEHQFVWGTGGHSGAHGSQVFPDAMRYLWKDWPQPIKSGLGAPQLKEILIPGEDWQEAAAFPENKPKNELLRGGTVVEASNGTGYEFTSVDDSAARRQVSWLVLVRQDRGRTVVDRQAPAVQSLTLSSDQTLLYVADNTHWIYSYQIQPDGTLAHKQKYYHLHVPDNADNAGAGGMCVDRDGRLYVATAMGIQVCDQAGRVNSIIPVPGGAATSVVLGGPDFDTLFAASGGKIYKRKVKTKGAPSFLPPVKPAPPRL